MINEALREANVLGGFLKEASADDRWQAPDLSQMDTGSIDLSPLGFGSVVTGEDTLSELIFRWNKGLGVLVAIVMPQGSGDPEQVAIEDKLLADFLVSRLQTGNALRLGPLVVEAYARYPELGKMPGSSAFEVVSRDPRMRLTAGDASRPAEAAITHADRLTYEERRRLAQGDEAVDRWTTRWREEVRRRIGEHPQRLRQAWARESARMGFDENQEGDQEGRVVLLRKPTHEELIDEWNTWLMERAISDKVRRRKVGHLETFVHYLETHQHEAASHLLDVGLSSLESFFFWTYIRRFPNSQSDVASFTLDIRDFYRFQESRGRIADARFAELIYGVRAMVAERLELYESLIAYEEDFDELFEELFMC